MGFKTKKKNGISKLIVDLPEDLHSDFKSLTAKQGYSMRVVIENLILQYNNKKISVDSKLFLD